jgi:hypothetical protein
LVLLSPLSVVIFITFVEEAGSGLRLLLGLLPSEDIGLREAAKSLGFT